MENLFHVIESQEKTISHLSNKINQIEHKEWYNRAWFVLTVSGLGVYGTLISDENKTLMGLARDQTAHFLDKINQNTTEEEIVDFFLSLD